MKRGAWVTVGMLVLAGALAWRLEARADQPTQWALLVGIDRYERSDVASLNFAVADVKSLATTLKSVCHVPEDNVFVLTSDQSGDNAPKKNNVAYRLDWLAKHVKPADTVFFFFSGHGIEMDGNSYLMTWEADPRSASTLEETGVETRKLQTRLAAIKSNRLLVLIDACRNDPRSGKGSVDNKMGKGLAKDLVVTRRPSGAAASANSGPLSATLFACSPNQRSYEWDQQGHGFFTYFLIQGLSGKAADASGRVTVGGLSAYLGTAVGRSTERNAPATQVPWLRAEGDVNSLSSWTVVPVRPAAGGPPVEIPTGAPQASPQVASQVQPARPPDSPPGGEVVNPKDGTVLLMVPAGEFFYGARSDDAGAYDDEKPGRRLSLPAFQMAKYPVTNAQYARFVAETGHSSARRDSWKEYAVKWGDQAPLVCVDWNDANAYCQWAGLRLPSEQEWERAARGADGRIYPWGDTWDVSRLVCSADRPQPVGSRPSGKSPAGCLDMVGNVQQWTSSDGDPRGYKACRGMSWNHDEPRYFRCSNHDNQPPNACYNVVGFRCARTP